MRRNHVTKSHLGWFRRPAAEQRRGGSTYYYEEDLL